MNVNYRRVQKQKETENILPNEIRVTSSSIPRNTITYALSLFESTEKKYDEVVLKAMGIAINTAVTVAEIIKRRVKGIHQTTEIQSNEVTDEWEPLEQGLKKLVTKRTVASITIRLSTKQLDTKHPGYQQPIPESQVQPQAPRVVSGDDQQQQEQQGEPRQRGRGRGRGRGGFRGRGRGGFRGGRGRGAARGGMRRPRNEQPQENQ